MTHKLQLSSVLGAVLVLSACTSVPTGPGMLALPGTGKSFNQFLFDDADCRQYASAQVGGRTANEAAADSGGASAVAGTLIGTGESSGLNLQQRYDFAYHQCMYAKGHRVPVSDRLKYSRQPVKDSNYSPSIAPREAPSLPSAGSFVPPPPPPGTPPPPPPDIDIPPTTPDDALPLMPSDDFQPLKPSSGGPPSPASGA